MGIAFIHYEPMAALMPLTPFGLISACKLPRSTVLLNSFVLFQKELSTVVWRLKPQRPVHGKSFLHLWLTEACIPLLTPSIPLSLTEKTWWQQGDLVCSVCTSRSYPCTGTFLCV